MTESVGTLAQACLDTALPIDTASLPMLFISEDVKLTTTRLEDDGLRGSRSRQTTRIAYGNTPVAGSIVMEPTPVELDYLLPWILGAAESTDTFAVAETIPVRYWMFDRVAKLFTYPLYVNSAVFSFRTGEKMKLTVNVIGTTETVAAAGGFPVLTIDAARTYTCAEIVLTLGGTAYAFEELDITIDNKAEATFMNSASATDIDALDRMVMIGGKLKYTSAEASLYTTLLAGTAVTGTVVATNGGVSTTFTTGSLKAATESPVVPGRSKLRWPINLQAYASGATKELVVTHDSAP